MYRIRCARRRRVSLVVEGARRSQRASRSPASNTGSDVGCSEPFFWCGCALRSGGTGPGPTCDRAAVRRRGACRSNREAAGVQQDRPPAVAARPYSRSIGTADRSGGSGTRPTWCPCRIPARPNVGPALSPMVGEPIASAVWLEDQQRAGQCMLTKREIRKGSADSLAAGEQGLELNGG